MARTYRKNPFYPKRSRFYDDGEPMTEVVKDGSKYHSWTRQEKYMYDLFEDFIEDKIKERDFQKITKAHTDDESE